MVELTNLLGTFGLVSMVGIALFIGLSDLAEKYNTPITDDLNETLTSFNEGFEQLNVMGTGMQNTSLGTSASQTTVSGFSFEGAVTTLKLSFTSFGIMSNMMGNIERQLGIPPIFRIQTLYYLMLVIMIIMIGVIFGRRLGT